MTRQEIFNKVATHLLTQNKRSEYLDGERPECLYRGPDGLKCAIGVLIPDDKYTIGIEGCSVGSKNVRDALECVGIDVKNNLDLLLDLQMTHDSVGPSYWEQSLKEYAEYNNLTMPTISQGK